LQLLFNGKLTPRKNVLGERIGSYLAHENAWNYHIPTYEQFRNDTSTSGKDVPQTGVFQQIITFPTPWGYSKLAIGQYGAYSKHVVDATSFGWTKL